jgi:hypothetical protein
MEQIDRNFIAANLNGKVSTPFLKKLVVYMVDKGHTLEEFVLHCGNDPTTLKMFKDPKNWRRADKQKKTIQDFDDEYDIEFMGGSIAPAYSAALKANPNQKVICRMISCKQYDCYALIFSNDTDTDIIDVVYGVD